MCVYEREKETEKYRDKGRKTFELESMNQSVT